MSELTRYESEYIMYEQPDGEYVRLADVRALVEEFQRIVDCGVPAEDKVGAVRLHVERILAALRETP